MRKLFIVFLFFSNSISAQLSESMESDIGISFRFSKHLFYSGSEAMKDLIDSALLVTPQNEPIRFYGCKIKAVKEQLYSSIILNIDSGLQIAVGFMPVEKNNMDKGKIIYAEYFNGKTNFVVDEIVTVNYNDNKKNNRNIFEKEGLKIVVDDKFKIVLFSVPRFEEKYFVLLDYPFNSFKK